MAVRQINQWQPYPGRGADTIAALSEAKRIQERLGGRARAWQSIAAGEGQASFSYTLESDTMADHLNLLGELRGSPEWQDLVRRVLAVATPPAVQLSSVVTTEIPGMDAGLLTGEPGTMVASVFLWQVKPGRLNDMIAGGRETQTMAETMGAKISAWVNTYAGTGAGMVGAAFIFDGYAAMAAYQQKAATNEPWQALLQRNQTADAPGTLVSSALLSEVPI